MQRPNIATLTSTQAKAIGAGYTYGYANGDIPVNDGCGCLFESSQITVPINVCAGPVPGSETTTYAGLTYITEGSFVMTLQPSVTCDFNGHNVQESNYATGTDTCYWPG